MIMGIPIQPCAILIYERTGNLLCLGLFEDLSPYAIYRYLVDILVKKQIPHFFLKYVIPPFELFKF